MTKNITPFFDRLWKEADINEHLPILFGLGLQCRTIVEFGVREGNSTVAFLAALKMQSRHTKLYSYDIRDCSTTLGENHGLTDTNTIWTFLTADTSKLSKIPDCDLLFIDTLHTHDQVVAEVEHHVSVSRWMVFHDTVLYGEHGEQSQPGIRLAIDTFRHRNPQWRLAYEYRNNNGLMILQRT